MIPRMKGNAMGNPDVRAWYDEVVARVRARRIEMRMRQSQVGELLGCTQVQYNRGEKQVTFISLPMLACIAMVLKKPVSYFIPAVMDSDDEFAPGA